MGSGTIGWALPAALGAKLAAQEDGTNRPVIAIVGDGGLQFSMQELGTMMQENLPVVLVLFDDSAYGVIKHFQKTRYGKETGATMLKNPHFEEVASAYGLLYRCVLSPDRLGDTIRGAITSERPAMIHCPICIRPPERL
jgi:acetolactate synthase-1/2/3 large subunit